MGLPTPWPDNLRQVRALRLRVPDADQAAGARIALEDGLACADFGDWGRLIFVRRLSLPAFARGFTGPAAARAIEASFRASLPEAVHGADPRAPRAPVVWFADLLEARLEALSLRVEGRALTAWYWRRVDELLARSVEPDIVTLFDLITRGEPGDFKPTVALKELARRWRRWSDAAFETFIAALPAMAETTGPAPGRPDRPEAAIYKSEPLPRALGGAVGRLDITRRVAPRRLGWLAQAEMLAADSAAGEAIRSVSARQVREWLDHRGDPAAPAPTVNVSIAEPSDAPALQGAIARETRVVTPPPVDSRPAPDEPTPNRESRRALPERILADPGLPPWLADARETRHAGFFMLLNAWRAAGADDWLDRHPDARDAWLEDWARRLALPREDLQRTAWEPPDPEMVVSDGLGHWRRASRRWLRTAAHIGAASLVARGGRVAMTRTHLDVVLPLSDVDLRVRRVGLDQDPGWVPWLGKIVAFHYVSTGNAS